MILQDAATTQTQNTLTTSAYRSSLHTQQNRQTTLNLAMPSNKTPTFPIPPSFKIRRSATSDYRYLPFDITSDDRKDSLLELFTFRLTEDNVLEHRSQLALADSDFIDKGDHLYKVDYDYRFSNGVISGSSCRGTLSDIDSDGNLTTAMATQDIARSMCSEQTRLYDIKLIQMAETISQIWPGVGSNDYLTIFESLDPSDIDRDGVTNAEDPYPLIPDDVADTDSDGQPNECNALATCRSRLRQR